VGGVLRHECLAGGEPLVRVVGDGEVGLVAVLNDVGRAVLVVTRPRAGAGDRDEEEARALDGGGDGDGVGRGDGGRGGVEEVGDGDRGGVVRRGGAEGEVGRRRRMTVGRRRQWRFWCCCGGGGRCSRGRSCRCWRSSRSARWLRMAATRARSGRKRWLQAVGRPARPW
jgi:hypothetical protein